VGDYGPGMDVGAPGKTRLTSVWDGALNTVTAAKTRNDRVGVYTVDSDGVARRHRSTGIRRLLPDQAGVGVAVPFDS